MSNPFKKVPPALAAAFDAALPASPLVQRRQMFGCPCAFVNGNMFAGLHEERLIVRLPDQAPQRPFVVMGRTMKEYAAFEAALELGEAEMARWIDAAFQRAALLAPKAAKAKKRAGKPAGRSASGGGTRRR
jgi:TfoX/Sxy family transcriptional regulator of competence genes